MQMRKISFSRKELEVFAIKALGLKSASLRRMSTLFLAQLFQMNMKGGRDTSEMVNEIKYLENRYEGIKSAVLDAAGSRKTPDAWIVFKRHNGTNYYLTLANMDEGDQNINQRLRDAYRFDFPFLEEKHRLRATAA
jgi:hypothetical protein